MNKYYIFTLLLSGLLFTSCNKNIKNLFDRGNTKLEVNEVDFDYLSAKAKVDFQSEKNLSLTANFRIRKDSVIWISLSAALGIEAARILVGQDTIYVMNKLDKSFDQMDYASVSKDFDFDITYKLIQSVILGNLIFPYDREQIVRSDKDYTYATRSGNYRFENSIGALSKKLEKIQVKDAVTKNEVSVQYQDFQLVGEQIFPFKIFTLLEYGGDTKKEDTKVDIEFNKIEIEDKPLKFPFNVPQRYEVE
ncbi:MAG: DUF4292 domain-containing protein [Bacteroidota bacterium]